MKYSRIKKNIGHLCRSCMNDVYGIHLTPHDCDYAMYPALCYRCGEVKNIVTNIHSAKRMKIRFTPLPKDKHS